MISVVVRTKNEIQWIHRCLSAIALQNYPKFEVVVVDNESTDGTLDIVKKFGCRLVTIKDADFTFGRSLNIGIETCRGDFIAMVSGHCVPLNERWLQMLRGSFNDQRVAGVYGRQEPLPDTDPFNKRDLWTTFGTERKVQSKDFFFHNANSMILRRIWRDVPFDDEISGVEDRDWAKKVLARGHRIVYQPDGSVYHFHGIHHGRDEKRAARVVRVIELIHQRNPLNT